MASSNTCWGIEVGAGAVKAVKLEADGERVTVLDFAIIPHKKVLSTPGLDQDDATRLALGMLTAQFDLSGSPVAISVPGHMAFARFAKLPPVERKRVPDIVKFEAVQQIPFPLDEVEWDYQTFVSPNSPDVEVGIFAIKRDRIFQRLSMYAEVGIVPDHVTLSPVAAYNALAYDLQFTEDTPGTIILDVGTTSTDLIVAEAGRVWVRTFQLGGHNFTEALVEAFKLSYSKAERLKREAEQSKHARHVFQAMRPVFADLAQEVQRSIGYYQSLHPDAQLQRLIGLGSTFQLPGVRKFLKQQLGLDVYRIEQFKRLSPEGPRSAEFQAASLNLATAYGCALQGLDLNSIKANLVPVAIVRDSMWRKKVKWFGIAASLAVAAGGAMFIRPFLDANAIAANGKPAVIDEVGREFNDQKQRAQAAGVLGSAESDVSAAQMVELLRTKGVFAHLTNDLSLMLEDAQAKHTGTGRAYEMNEFRTEYVPPELVVAKGKEASAPAGGDPYRGGGPGGRDFQPYGEEIEEGAWYGQNEQQKQQSTRRVGASSQPAEVPEAIAGNPAVRVTLRVTTPIADNQTFMIRTLEAWLRDAKHVTRQGVPYTIVTGDDVWVQTSTRQTSATGREGGQLVEQPGRPSRRSRFAEQQPIEGGEIYEGNQPTGVRGGDMGQLAPLPSPPPAYPPGTQLTTFEVTWIAVVAPAALAEQNADETDQGGGA